MFSYEPLTGYVKLRVARASGIPWMFSLPPTLKKKPLVSDPGMHHSTCVTYVSWCMSGSLTHGGGENIPGIPGACATCIFAYLVRGPCCYQILILGPFSLYKFYCILPENRCPPLAIPSGVLQGPLIADIHHIMELSCPQGHVFGNGKTVLYVLCDVALSWNDTVGDCSRK